MNETTLDDRTLSDIYVLLSMRRNYPLPLGTLAKEDKYMWAMPPEDDEDLEEGEDGEQDS